MRNALKNIINHCPDTKNPWNGAYKIPWNDPEFSRRMLAEHLTQEHDLASRRQQTLERLAAWIHAEVLKKRPSRILDLGCGPGLFAPLFAGQGHSYAGMDFGPASIEHANQHFARPGQCEFVLGDVLSEPFGGPHDLVCMLYGELNVFPPDDCRRILAKAHAALAPGGRLALEVQTFEAVRQNGLGRSWYATEGGLFAEGPHLCLVENHWLEDQAVAQQFFHVIDPGQSGAKTYASTTQAYADEEYEELLRAVGFGEVRATRGVSGTDSLIVLDAIRN